MTERPSAFDSIVHWQRMLNHPLPFCFSLNSIRHRRALSDPTANPPTSIRRCRDRSPGRSVWKFVRNRGFWYFI